VCAWSLEDGQLLEARSASDGLRPTACCGAPEGDTFVLGFEDGRVRAGRIGFHYELATREQRLDAWQALDGSGRGRLGKELVELGADGS
jgi:hypothetical protein